MQGISELKLITSMVVKALSFYQSLFMVMAVSGQGLVYEIIQMAQLPHI